MERDWALFESIYHTLKPTDPLAMEILSLGLEYVHERQDWDGKAYLAWHGKRLRLAIRFRWRVC